MIVQVRKAQAELLLQIRRDVDLAQAIARQAQAKLDTACAAVLAGIVPDGSGISEVRLNGEVGEIVMEAPCDS